MDLKRLSSDNPLIAMLLRFVGEVYFRGGPRPEMLLDFATHYQALCAEKANYVESGYSIPQYTKALAGIEKLELPGYEKNKGWQAYRMPRMKLCAMQNEEIEKAYQQFKKVLSVLSTNNNLLVKNLRRVKTTLSMLNTVFLSNAAPSIPRHRF